MIAHPDRSSTTKMAKPLTAMQAALQDPKHLRGCAEEYHYEAQRRSWLRPFIIQSISPCSETLEVPNQFHKRVAKTIAQLDPDDCRQFCWKDCPIYCNTSVNAMVHVEILEFVYREWFPHRDRERDISFDSFFGKSMRFYPPVDMAEMVSFHQRLCERLAMLELDVLAPEYTKSHPKHGHVRERGLFKLRETFCNLFMVADHKDWRERGVLLVCKDEETATAHGINETKKEDLSREKSFEVEDMRSTCVFRMSVKRAMQAVVFRDGDRGRRRREYNEAFEEYLGSEDES